MNLLCEDYSRAALNRQRVKSGHHNKYYNTQSRKAAMWVEGNKLPKGLRLGELPQITITTEKKFLNRNHIIIEY